MLYVSSTWQPPPNAYPLAKSGHAKDFMAEFKFTCTSCKQNIICDELWCGQPIECPSCKAELVVPAQSSPSSSPLVPPPPPPGAAPKLSIGRHQQASSSTAPAGQRFIPGTRPLPP